MHLPDDEIARNLGEVRERIGAAARRAGREPGEITLIAVSKTFGADRVRAAIDAGQRDFGENKVRKAAQPFACIHSIDSIDLLQRVDAEAAEGGATPDILVQVDLAGESTKFGAPIAEARRIVDAALACRAARLAGLMLLPPWNDDQEQTRPWFARLRELREQWISEGVPRDALAQLSMGMSHDFEAAIEEGTTIVRIGTAIFGGRPPMAGGT